MHGAKVTDHGAEGTARQRRRAGSRSIAARVSPGPPYDDGVARDLAIDLGTSNTQVFAKGKGVILEEPTVIALNTRTHEVLAVGDEALQLIGRTPGTSSPCAHSAKGPSPTSTSPSGPSGSCCSGPG